MAKGKYHRSPNYPAIDLKTAVARTKTLYEQNKRHPVSVAVATGAWGYKPSSSAGQQCVAALKAYGLVDVEGTGKDRRVRVSDAGWKVVGNHEDRAELLRQAAQEPTIFCELWEMYGGDLPSDDAIHNYLVFDRDEGTFNEESVGDVIARFRETIKFAELDNPDMLDEDKDGETGTQPSSSGHDTKPTEAKGRRVPEGSKQDVFATDTGEVVVTWPAALTPDDYADISGWIDILKRKIKRCVQNDPPSEGAPINGNGEPG